MPFNPLKRQLSIRSWVGGKEITLIRIFVRKFNACQTDFSFNLDDEDR